MLKRFFSGWRPYILQPASDALLNRSPQSPALTKHALDFPGMLAEAQDAMKSARSVGFQTDENWLVRFSKCSALDRQDNFSKLFDRSLVSSDRLEIVGSWPKPPFVALFMHWGSGVPALEHLQTMGLEPSLVYQPDSPDTLSSLAARTYDKLHMRVLLSFGKAIKIGGAHQQFLQAFSDGRNPVAVIDGVPRKGSRVASVIKNGRTIHLRAALLHLLAERSLPFVFFRCWHPRDSEKRRLEISSKYRSSDFEEVTDCAANFFIESIQLDSAQWHFWGFSRSFFGPGRGSNVKSAFSRDDL